MTICVFIFARGGSKGLPRKNIKLLAGKPLIQYSIEIARKLENVTQVFVSTEDEEIANISTSLGATVIARPKILAIDTSKEWDAWQHAVKWVFENYGQFDTFVSLPATSPLRSESDIKGAIAKLSESSADICVSVTESNRSPFFNMVRFDPQGYVSTVVNSEPDVFRRQDAPPVFDMTTVVYVTKPEFIMAHKGVFDGKVSAVIIPKDRAVDIDDIYDFKLAEVILQERINAKG